MAAKVGCNANDTNEEEGGEVPSKQNEKQSEHSSVWSATAQQILSPTLALPSMSSSVSLPLFESLSKLRHDVSPLDYIDIDEEQLARQSTSNARVRVRFK